MIQVNGPTADLVDVMTPISRLVNAERLALAGWPRAILLQLAHPLVAAGVAGHSTFRTGRTAAARRLHETTRAMLSLTFGDEAAHARTIERIRDIHTRVNGNLRTAVGPFPAGTPYSAEDPELLLWVHLTLMESVVLAYDAIVAPLDAARRDAYCGEAAPVAIALGASPDAVPRTWSGIERAMADRLASGQIVVGPDALEVAAGVLHPPLGALMWPAPGILRLLTAGWLPPSVREGYGFQWDARRAKRHARAIAALRRVRRIVPSRLATFGQSRAATAR